MNNQIEYEKNDPGGWLSGGYRTAASATQPFTQENILFFPAT